jgi:4-amino-4-deoxy-L-arabinose transferase-like glycosyltransferase
MSLLPTSPKPSRTDWKPSIRRLAAWVALCARNPRTAVWLVAGFALAHAVLWTLILVNLKAAQDVHGDIAEAFAWGQKFQLGYGKHPPLSGWIAGLWFQIFPVADWSAYALAMATVSCALVLCWWIAINVVDGRRAFFATVMLALYPIFNFKGFKFNADLVQLVPLPLLVLTYLHAYKKRSAISGIWLGLAAALALMSKYWVLTMIGAIGLAALIHPERLKFLRSPAPWIAIATLLIAITPHLIWLVEVDFLPLTYAGDIYSMSDHLQNLRLVLGYIGHNLLLILTTVALAALALYWGALTRRPQMRLWSSGSNQGVDLSQALNVWTIQIIVAIGPPLGALLFDIYLKTDWGISLFFLMPLSLVAIPRLRVPAIALFRLCVVWLLITLVTLFASPGIAVKEQSANPSSTSTYGARSQLARELTQVWHNRFHMRWAVVAGDIDISGPMAFYSPDHPVPLSLGELWTSGLTSLEEARRLGFIGICDVTNSSCAAWMKKNAPHAEQLTMATQRSFHGHSSAAHTWAIYVVPPGH